MHRPLRRWRTRLQQLVSLAAAAPAMQPLGAAIISISKVLDPAHSWMISDHESQKLRVGLWPRLSIQLTRMLHTQTHVLFGKHSQSPPQQQQQQKLQQQQHLHDPQAAAQKFQVPRHHAGLVSPESKVHS
jgi:hypothetical protein